MLKSKFFLLIVLLLSTSQIIAQDSGWRFGAGISLHGGSSANGDMVVTQLSNGAQLGKGDIEFETKAGPSLSFEARHSNANSWGFGAGVQVGTKVKFKKLKMKLNGTTTEMQLEGEDKLQETSIYANAIYRWNSFYLPFGLNYTALSYSPKDPNFTIDGGIGLQLGFGFWLTNNFTIDVMVKASSLELTSKDTTDDIQVKMEEAAIANLALGVKYFF